MCDDRKTLDPTAPQAADMASSADVASTGSEAAAAEESPAVGRAAGQPKELKPSATAVIDRELFTASLRARLAELDIPLTAEQETALADYYEVLVETNRVMNLTGITEAAEVAEKHIADSLRLLSYLEGCARVVDVGTGAGLPGIPLAIMLPECRFVLVDSLQKRCRFLEQVKAQLGLANVEIVRGRAEELGRQAAYREGFDAAPARAVAALPILLEYLLPLVRVGGRAIAMKGSQTAAEVAAAERALRLLHGRVDRLDEYELSGGEQRSIISVEKTAKQDKRYPRQAAQIKKSPL